MIQVAKKVPFEDPNVLNAVRALYVISNLIIVGIYYYLKVQIDKKKGESSSHLPYANIQTTPALETQMLTVFPPAQT